MIAFPYVHPKRDHTTKHWEKEFSFSSARKKTRKPPLGGKVQALHVCGDPLWTWQQKAQSEMGEKITCEMCLWACLVFSTHKAGSRAPQLHPAVNRAMANVETMKSKGQPNLLLTFTGFWHYRTQMVAGCLWEREENPKNDWSNFTSNLRTDSIWFKKIRDCDISCVLGL